MKNYKWKKTNLGWNGGREKLKVAQWGAGENIIVENIALGTCIFSLSIAKFNIFQKLVLHQKGEKYVQTFKWSVEKG